MTSKIHEMMVLYGKCVLRDYHKTTHLSFFNPLSNKNVDKKTIVLKKYLAGELPSDEELHDKEIF